MADIMKEVGHGHEKDVEIEEIEIKKEYVDHIQEVMETENRRDMKRRSSPSLSSSHESKKRRSEVVQLVEDEAAFKKSSVWMDGNVKTELGNCFENDVKIEEHPIEEEFIESNQEALEAIVRRNEKGHAHSQTRVKRDEKGHVHSQARVRRDEKGRAHSQAKVKRDEKVRAHSQARVKRDEKGHSHSQSYPDSKKRQSEVYCSEVTVIKSSKMDMSQVERLPWTKDSEVSLLELVRKNRNVWDQRNALYHKHSLRRSTYQTIADTLILQYPQLSDLTAEHVRHKLKNIRTYFMILYKKIKKSSNGSMGQVTHKWPLFDSATFLLESIVNTSDNSCSKCSSSSSSSSLHAKEETKSKPKVVASLWQPSTTLDQQKNGSAVSAQGRERPRFKDISPSTSLSGSQTSTCASVSVTAPHSRITPSVKSTSASPKYQTKKSVSIGISNYLKKKHICSPMAVSLGSLVEAAVDRMPHDKQIWFAQKLSNLIAEANNLPIVPD